MQATHRPIKNAEVRTKNRFKEHTLVEVRRSINTRSWILFESAEKDNKGRFAKWAGWIAVSEVERIEG
jgi:hypothetical protein